MNTRTYGSSYQTRTRQVLFIFIHLVFYCGLFTYICEFITNHLEQEAPECDEIRFSTIKPSIDVTGIRNERWHTHTLSLVSIGQRKLHVSY